MSIMVTSKAVKSTSHGAEYDPEKFPGIDQTITEFNRDTIRDVKALWNDPKEYGKKERILDYLDKRIAIAERMLNSRWLKNAPTLYNKYMDALDLRLYQEREIMNSTLEFLIFTKQLTNLA